MRCHAPRQFIGMVASHLIRRGEYGHGIVAEQDGTYPVDEFLSIEAGAKRTYDAGPHRQQGGSRRDKLRTRSVERRFSGHPARPPGIGPALAYVDDGHRRRFPENDVRNGGDADRMDPAKDTRRQAKSRPMMSARIRRRRQARPAAHPFSAPGRLQAAAPSGKYRSARLDFPARRRAGSARARRPPGRHSLPRGDKSIMCRHRHREKKWPARLAGHRNAARFAARHRKLAAARRDDRPTIANQNDSAPIPDTLLDQRTHRITTKQAAAARACPRIQAASPRPAPSTAIDSCLHLFRPLHGCPHGHA